MNVLGIESSGRVGSAAAWANGQTLVEETLTDGMSHGRMLVNLIDRVLAKAGWSKTSDVHLIAVSRGPGSFTGLRVGLTCAKTLATMAHLPIVGVCSLDAMALNAGKPFERVLTVLDAKRGDVYAAAYERRENVMERVHDPEAMAPEQAKTLLASPMLVMGDALLRHSTTFISGSNQAAPEELWRIRATRVAELGWRAFSAGYRDDPLALDPLYLRRPEAEEKRLAREKGAS